MRITILILTLFFGLSGKITAQEEVTTPSTLIKLGIEFQAYPTGLIPGIRTEFVFNNKNALNVKLGYNFLNHRDLGVHLSEKGGGFGGTIGWRRYFENEGLKGFFVGAKSDIWFNKVNWDDISITGTSNIVVLQPTIEAGYAVKFANDLLSFEPNLAFGWEWNVKTSGEITFNRDLVNIDKEEVFKTGQGPIILLGFSFMIALNR